MAVIRCPHCNKPNPDFLEICQYCDLPLKAAIDAPPPGAPSAEDVPDWLKGVQATAPEASANDTPDWLKPASAPSETPDFDWLKPAPTAASTGATDWLNMPAAQPAEDVPDWLKGMQAEAPAAPAEDVPDWLKGMQAEAPAAPAEDVPDWLKGMQAEAPATPTGASAQPEPEAPAALAEDVPDWLKGMQAEAPATPTGASAQPEPEAPAAPAEDVPDWLKGMPSTTAPLPAAPTNDLPAWLMASTGPLPELPISAPGKPATAPLPELTDDAPDWLKAMRDQAATDQPATADWHSDQAAQPDWASPTTPPAASEPEWLAEASSAPATAPTETPDWLTSIGASNAESDQPGISPFTTTDFDTSEVAETPASGGTPDWLAALRPTAPPSGDESPADDLLAQTALPSWLSAMRPISASDAAIAPEQDDYEEKLGVLAGMRGVLQAEPLVVLPRKAAEQVHKLTFSQDQLRQAKLLAQQWAADSAEVAAPAAKKALRLPIARWVITLLLMVAVAGPMLALPGLFQRPTSLSLSVERAHQSVEAAPLDQPTLVVFDYEPLHSGELSVAAEAVLAHLMRRGVPVVAVSTLPTGAAQAERTLRDAATQPQDFPIAKQPEIDYLNLGYIPGGQVGVLQFATQPRLAFSASFSGTANIWQNAILTEVRTLDDFGLLVLVASDPALVRAWMEQTRALVGDTPVIAAVSASAEPLVRPYYESQQLAGLVGGIIEAGQYEQRTIRPYGRALQSWDGLGGGLYMAALIILAGSVFYGARAFARPTKKR